MSPPFWINFWISWCQFRASYSYPFINLSAHLEDLLCLNYFKIILYFENEVSSYRTGLLLIGTLVINTSLEIIFISFVFLHWNYFNWNTKLTLFINFIHPFPSIQQNNGTNCILFYTLWNKLKNKKCYNYAN